MSRDTPPHPDAARPPSPARGEGAPESAGKEEHDAQANQRIPRDATRRRANRGDKGTLVSLGARSRGFSGHRLHADAATNSDQPSPLAGEGGERHSRSPGEGDKRHPSSRLASARKLRGTMTEAEWKLWSLLRNRKLVGSKFRRQVPIGSYVADFLCFEARLIVEADGGQHAGGYADAVRDSWLQSQGFRILRLWNNDILNNPKGVLANLQSALDSTPASQTEQRLKEADPA